MNLSPTVEDYKLYLSPELRRFVDDFKVWSKEDKSKIQIVGSSLVIGNLPDHISQKYENNVDYYLDQHTAGKESLRRALCKCIELIQTVA